MSAVLDDLDLPSLEDLSGGFDGANWIRANLGADLSPFETRVADILGRVWRGIYHMPANSLRRAHWKGEMVELQLPGGLKTCGPGLSALTELVLLCHEASIQLEISPATQRFIRLQFFKRKRVGRPFEVHPTLEQAIATLEAATVQEDAQ